MTFRASAKARLRGYRWTRIDRVRADGLDVWLAALAWVARETRPQLAEVLNALLRVEGAEEALADSARRLRQQPWSAADVAREIRKVIEPMRLPSLAGDVEQIAVDRINHGLGPSTVQARHESTSYFVHEAASAMVQAFNLAGIPLNYSADLAKPLEAHLRKTRGKANPDDIATVVLVALAGLSTKHARNAVERSYYERKRR